MGPMLTVMIFFGSVFPSLQLQKTFHARVIPSTGKHLPKLKSYWAKKSSSSPINNSIPL